MENIKCNKYGNFKFQKKNNIKLLKRIIFKGNENKNINDYSFNKANLNDSDNEDEKNNSLKLKSNYHNSSLDSEDSIEKSIKLKKIKISNGEEEINFIVDNEINKNKNNKIKRKNIINKDNKDKNNNNNNITNNNENDFDFGNFLRQYSLKNNQNQTFSKIKNGNEENKNFGVIKINKTKTL